MLEPLGLDAATEASDRTMLMCPATLLHRLDAQTRFQAAVAAARRGWL